MWEWTALCERDGGDSDSGEREIVHAQGETSWHMETTQAVKTLLTVAFGPRMLDSVSVAAMSSARTVSVKAARLAHVESYSQQHVCAVASS